MSSNELQDLRNFLTTFQVEALGQGDINIGINTLASMAVVLADLAPHDGTILTRDNRPARLGVNLIISGSASTGRVVDEVLTEVGRRQHNFAAHLRCYIDLIKRLCERKGAGLPTLEPESRSLLDEFALTRGSEGSLGPFFSNHTQIWSRVLNQVPTETVAKLALSPKFLVTAARPGDLENQLRGLRPGRPLVHLGLSQPADLARLADPGAALVEGRFTPGTGCATVCANLLITDPMQMLGEAAKTPDDRTAWLGHFLWLCDGEAGPEAPPAAAQEPDVPETVAERFRLVLDQTITRRLNLPEEKLTHLALETREAAIRWTAFLGEMEPRLPGISGAARNLITSLVFGLGEMARIRTQRIEDPWSVDPRREKPRTEVPWSVKPLPVSMAGVEAFARFLVLRMVNVRTVVLHSAAMALRRSQIERVYWKLSRGPAEPREIYHNLGLPAGDCHECLQWMQEAGIARQVDRRKWELVENTRLNFDHCGTPLLEI